MDSKTLKNNLNQPFDRFIVRFETIDEVVVFNRLLVDIFEMETTMELSKPRPDVVFPIIVSFTIVFDKSEQTLVFTPEQLLEYLDMEKDIVHEQIFNISNNFKEIEQLLGELY